MDDGTQPGGTPADATPQSGSVHEVHRLAADVMASCRQLTKTSTLSLDVRATVDALVAVEHAARALEAARLGLVRALDGADLLAVGSVSLAGTLTDRLLTAPGRARADVAAARAIDPDPVLGGPDAARGTLTQMGQALAEGAVSRAHLDVAVKSIEKIPHRIRAAAAATVDEFFVEVSMKYPPRACEQLADELLDRLDPDRTDRAFDPDAFARRSFDLVPDSTGMFRVRGQLDPMTGAQLKAAVEHFAAPDPARTDPDSGLVLGRDERTPTQRRADAVGTLARLGLANAGTRGGEPPRVVVHATADQVAALAEGRTLGEQTAAGRAWCEQTGFITPDTLNRFGCSAVFERVLLAPNGAVLNLGRTVRLASPAQRRALAARDKGCTIPGCTRPAHQTDAHHLHGWASGHGQTNIDELVLLCGPHHNAVHAGIYDITMRDGIPWVRSTTRWASDGTWHRNTLHHDTTTARHTGQQIRLDLGLDPSPQPNRPPDEAPPDEAPPDEALPDEAPPDEVPDTG